MRAIGKPDTATEPEDTMIPYSSHHVATARHHDHLAAADQARLVRAARARAQGTSHPGRQPLAWLRDTTGAVADRLATFVRPATTARSAR